MQESYLTVQAKWEKPTEEWFVSSDDPLKDREGLIDMELVAMRWTHQHPDDRIARFNLNFDGVRIWPEDGIRNVDTPSAVETFSILGVSIFGEKCNDYNSIQNVTVKTTGQMNYRNTGRRRLASFQAVYAIYYEPPSAHFASDSKMVPRGCMITVCLADFVEYCNKVVRPHIQAAYFDIFINYFCQASFLGLAQLGSDPGGIGMLLR